jgi:hypothetical protein
MIPKSLPSDLIRGWSPVFGQDHAPKKCEGSGAPIGAPSVVRACANKRAQFAQTYLLRGSGPLCLLPLPRAGEGREGARSPFGAPPRHLPRRANAKTQSRPRFARTGGCGRYPHHRSRLSQAPGTPVIVPEGHSSLHLRKLRTVCDARTARERIAKPPAGTALAPPSGSHLESALRRARFECSTVTEIGICVKKNVTRAPRNRSAACVPSPRRGRGQLWRSSKYRWVRGRGPSPHPFLLLHCLAALSRKGEGAATATHYVGWVERSETHHEATSEKAMGFARASTHPTGYGLSLRARLRNWR